MNFRSRPTVYIIAIVMCCAGVARLSLASPSQTQGAKLSTGEKAPIENIGGGKNAVVAVVRYSSETHVGNALTAADIPWMTSNHLGGFIIVPRGDFYRAIRTLRIDASKHKYWIHIWPHLPSTGHLDEHPLPEFLGKITPKSAEMFAVDALCYAPIPFDVDRAGGISVLPHDYAIANVILLHDARTHNYSIAVARIPNRRGILPVVK